MKLTCSAFVDFENVMFQIIVAPLLAALAVAIGAPILLFYVYGVVPVSMCRSGGCGGGGSGAASRSGDDDPPDPFSDGDLEAVITSSKPRGEDNRTDFRARYPILLVKHVIIGFFQHFV